MTTTGVSLKTITKVSSVSNEEHSMDLLITDEQWAEWNSPNRRYIQHIFPNLSRDEREFLMTGITKEEWDELFKDEDT